ncbi:hypothetical protein B0G69_1562 [Paraburkholderia sp. RAU2J]|nr:hypothetical protein B0G69_1562 [Paraburkholderia sp. RAU2J]
MVRVARLLADGGPAASGQEFSYAIRPRRQRLRLRVK